MLRNCLYRDCFGEKRTLAPPSTAHPSFAFPLPHRWLRQKRAVRFEQLNIVAGLSLIPLSSASTRTSKRHPFAVRLPTTLAPPPLGSVSRLLYGPYDFTLPPSCLPSLLFFQSRKSSPIDQSTACHQHPVSLAPVSLVSTSLNRCQFRFLVPTDLLPTQ